MKTLFAAFAFLALSTLGGVAYAQPAPDPVPVETPAAVSVTEAPATADTVVVAPESGTPTDITTDTTVVIPYGSWLDTLLQNMLGVTSSIIAVVVAYALRSLPSGIADAIRTFRVEQLLARAVEYGLNAVRGAIRDKELTVNVGSKVVAEAARYAIDRGPSALIKWVGGPEAIKEMITARLPLAADTAAGEVIAKANTP